MRGRVECPTRIITRLPRQQELARVGAPAFSEKAKRRLEVLDWYFKKSPGFSRDGKPNAVPTSVLTRNCTENRSNAALKAHERKRKPAGLKATKPNKVVEYDMKHVYLLGQKFYAFAAIDPFKKDAALRIATTPVQPQQQDRAGKSGRPLRQGHRLSQ